MNAKLIFTAGILVSLQSCGHSGTQPAQQEIRPVKVYATQPLGSVDKDFAGMSVADDISNLAFREPGQIVKMNVSEGQSVKKGTVIAEINPREYMLQMEADKATYLTAQSQLERNKRLIERQAISRQDYETAEAAYVRARTAYDNSKSILADTKLVAPFSGAVEKVYADNYQRVQAGEPVVRLVNPQTRSVKFTMPESGLQTLKLSGLAFTVRFDNYPNVVFDALLKEYVQSSTQAAGITVALTLDGQNVGKYDIAPGMACTVNLRVDIPDRRDMTGVPLTAVFDRDGKEYVWVVSDRAEAELREAFEKLYDRCLQDIYEGDESSYIFKHHISRIEQQLSYYDRTYTWQDDKDQAVVDYIASMTDGYFCELTSKLFPGLKFPHRTYINER